MNMKISIDKLKIENGIELDIEKFSFSINNEIIKTAVILYEQMMNKKELDKLMNELQLETIKSEMNNKNEINENNIRQCADALKEFAILVTHQIQDLVSPKETIFGKDELVAIKMFIKDWQPDTEEDNRTKKDILNKIKEE